MKQQQPILIKLTFVQGLQGVVSSEIAKYPELSSLLRVVERGVDFLYFDFIPATIPEVSSTEDEGVLADDANSSADIVESFLETLKGLMKLRSITNIYLV